MNIGPELTGIVLTIGALGGVGGLIGGFFAGRRATATGSVLMGIIGGISVAAIARVVDLPPYIDAGAGYSLAYALAGGALLAFVVGASNR